MPLKLIVGLCNPGDKFAQTRHNAGAWFIESLARHFSVFLRQEDKFHGAIARVQSDGHDCRLLLPTTFMNLSGQSVFEVAQFYKILPSEILICHDELDLPVGNIRLKRGGGHGGHNGLRDIIPRITSDFWRLRVGIGHPGDRDKVLHYVLHQPSKSEKTLIDEGLTRALEFSQFLLNCKMQIVMNSLNRK